LNDVPTVGGFDQLEVSIAEKTYPGATGAPVAALRDVSFTLPRGRVGALIGRSGSGKTTILRIVAGLDRRYSGTVGRPGEGRLGIVFQEPRLLPWRTLEQNVALAREAAGLAAGGEADLYPLLGLEGHRTRFPGELSLGLARRAAIARAFAVEPDLLLLDEPFVSLDGPTALRLRAELADLQERTRPTTLLVTHDLDEALALADVVFVLGKSPARIVATMPVQVPPRNRDASAIGVLRQHLAPLLPAD
jgi:ABC-type nitrate/sulfonate/bicarbonate transport system ATPase subunit